MRKLTKSEIAAMQKARVAVGTIRTLEDRNMVTWYVPRLAGRFVAENVANGWKYLTRAEALEAGRRIKASLADPTGPR